MQWHSWSYKGSVLSAWDKFLVFRTAQILGARRNSVGAGKTGSMFMGAMELHRRGLVSQPWIVVPTHLIEQFGRELPQWPS